MKISPQDFIAIVARYAGQAQNWHTYEPYSSLDWDPKKFAKVSKRGLHEERGERVLVLSSIKLKSHDQNRTERVKEEREYLYFFFFLPTF